MKKSAHLRTVEMPKAPSLKANEDAPAKTPSSIHVPIHSSHMKHAVPGTTVTVHVKGKVKGVRAAGSYNPAEVEIEPQATGVTPHGGKNPFQDLTEED